MKCRHKPSTLQTHHELFPTHTGVMRCIAQPLRGSTTTKRASDSLTALRAGPPFSWGVTSGGPPGGRSLSKDGIRADSAKDFCRLVGRVIRRKSDL